MKPSPTLCYRRMRFTTKQVGKGFYRGTRTGSMGAHTEWGGYVIDWRKVRHFVVPDLKDFRLTPFVSKEVERGPQKTAARVNGMDWLREWKEGNPDEYERIWRHQNPEPSELDEEQAQRRSADQASSATTNP